MVSFIVGMFIVYFQETQEKLSSAELETGQKLFCSRFVYGAQKRSESSIYFSGILCWSQFISVYLFWFWFKVYLTN
jgi:hypothetical protein